MASKSKIMQSVINFANSRICKIDNRLHNFWFRGHTSTS
jgi:hypothetical protein